MFVNPAPYGDGVVEHPWSAPQSDQDTFLFQLPDGTVIQAVTGQTKAFATRCLVDPSWVGGCVCVPLLWVLFFLILGFESVSVCFVFSTYLECSLMFRKKTDMLVA